MRGAGAARDASCWTRSALERADVLGYSLGGGLAQELAHRAPGARAAARAVRDRARPRRRPAAAAGRADAGHAGALLPPAAARVSLPYIAGGRTARDPACSRARRRAPRAPARACSATRFQLYAAAGWSSLPWLHTLPHADAGGGRRRRPGRAVRQRPHARRADSRTRGCTRQAAAGTCSCSTSPERAAAPIRAFLDDVIRSQRGAVKFGLRTQ